MKIKGYLVYFAISALVLISGCMETPNQLSRKVNSSANSTLASISRSNTLYQVSTIDAILQGVYVVGVAAVAVAVELGKLAKKV
jgi:beta-lactamase regulating signal transducer with metallopeptidase domain